MSRWPKAVLQFEDFQLPYAHPLLQRYKDQHLVFNDDIQVGSYHRTCHSSSKVTYCQVKTVTMVIPEQQCMYNAKTCWPSKAEGEGVGGKAGGQSPAIEVASL